MRNFLFVILFFSSLNALALDVLHLLKPYRTYYFAQRLSSMDHQFVVWVRENNQWRSYVTSKRNVFVFGEKPIPSGYTFDLFLQPVAKEFEPENNLETFPKEFPQVLETLKTNIAQIFPNAQEVRTRYLGVATRVRVIEFVPISNVDQYGNRLGNLTDNHYYINGNGIQTLYQAVKSFTNVGPQLFADKMILDIPSYLRMDGELLLRPGMESRPRYDRNYERYLEVLKDFVLPTGARTISRANQRDLLAEILKSQGEEPIPNVEQILDLDIYLYVNTNKLVEKVTIQLPLKEALENKLQVSAVSKLGLKFNVSGGIGEGRSLAITTLTNNGGHFSSYLKTTIKDLVRNFKGYVATFNSVQITGERQPVLSLPGSSIDQKFSNVVVQISPLITPSLETTVTPNVAYLDHGMPAPIDYNLLREMLDAQNCKILFE